MFFGMKKFWRTIWTLTEGDHGLYIWSLVVQLLMVVSQIFTFFLTKVLVDALTPLSTGGYALDNASGLEQAVVYLVSGGQGKELLYQKPWILAIVVAY
jgi:hypothetical protein